MLRTLAVLTAALSSPLIAPAIAQNTPAPASGVFEADYFARFSPTTAQDMVRQLPGFTIDDGDTVRGFGGAAGNVLINGERPSTKEPLDDLLRRIPASDIDRIEIVTSASGQLDMRGQTKIANVILRDTSDERSPVNWRAFLRHHQGGALTSQVSANTSYSVLGGQLNVDISAGQSRLQGPGNGTRDIGGRNYFDGSRTPIEAQDTLYHNEDITIEPAVQFNRKFSWGALRLNGKYDGCCGDGDSFSIIRAPDRSGPNSRYEATAREIENPVYTLGGDIERTFSNGASLKLIVLNERGQDNSDTLYSYFDGAADFTNSIRLQSDKSSGESIVRGQANWQLGDSHALGVALEGAYNFLDATTRVTLDTGLDVTPPGSDTIVEELRGEFEVSDIWTVNAQLTIEPIFRFEVSQIRQDVRINANTSFVEERTLTYPKPGISATWRPSEGRQVRVSLDREVSQLDFGNFVSALEVTNNFVTGGNTKLEPARTWALGGQYETAFWGDGVLTLRASHDWVESVEDFVCVAPVTVGPANTTPCIQRLDSFDGPGNLGDGTSWSAGFNVSIPLQRLGVKGGRLNVDYQNGNSFVTDPVTGRTRRFSNDFGRTSFKVDFRQDLPELQFSWGLEASDSVGGTYYRLRETYRRDRHGVELNAFIETTRFFGLNTRIGYMDILDTEYQSRRVVYDAPRLTGSPILYQEGFGRNGGVGYIRLAGSF